MRGPGPSHHTVFRVSCLESPLRGQQELRRRYSVFFDLHDFFFLLFYFLQIAAGSTRMELHDVQEDVLKFVFRYLYSGQAQILINQEAFAIHALQLADRWLMTDLVQILLVQLAKVISNENVFMILGGTESIACCGDIVKHVRRVAASFLIAEYHVLHEYDQGMKKREDICSLTLQKTCNSCGAQFAQSLLELSK